MNITDFELERLFDNLSLVNARIEVIHELLEKNNETNRRIKSSFEAVMLEAEHDKKASVAMKEADPQANKMFGQSKEKKQ